MDEVGRNKLWQEYMQTGKSEIREQLIAEYAQLSSLSPDDSVCIWAIM